MPNTLFCLFVFLNATPCYADVMIVFFKSKWGRIEFFKMLEL